jgi:shikimate dehydrogenase
VHGIVAALRDAGVDRVSTVTVIGAGATAVSALAAVRTLGARAAIVVARSPERARPALEAADEIGLIVDFDPWPGSRAAWSGELVVSTVPPGAADALADRDGSPGVLLDVVYAPWPSALASAAGAAGATVVGGLAMLVHQAAQQVELMTGQAAPLAAMRAAVGA